MANPSTPARRRLRARTRLRRARLLEPDSTDAVAECMGFRVVCTVLAVELVVPRLGSDEFAPETARRQPRTPRQSTALKLLNLVAGRGF